MREVVFNAVRESEGDFPILISLIFEMASLLGSVCAITVKGDPEGIEKMLDASREASDAAANTVGPTILLINLDAMGSC
jgi:hypothetical protein